MAALSCQLTLNEGIAIGLGLVVLGTLYCQAYCLLALQQMHGASMPLVASLGRASADVLPAFLVFEFGKRTLDLPRIGRWLALPPLFAAGITFGVLIRMQVHAMSKGLSLRHMAVDRIPFMLFAGAALAYYWLHQRSHSYGGEASGDRDCIPPAKAIDWVKAAGNYVEIRVAGQTRLVRMTLRQARAALPGDQFIQIHRSVIINRTRISSVKGRRCVQMTDGTEFTVGDAHRSNLPPA